MALKDLQISISYKSKGENNILDDFLIPAYRQSNLYKRSVGFFSSSVFELTGKAVSDFADRGGKIQLICSPDLSKEDIEAINLGRELKKEVYQNCLAKDIENCLNELEIERLVLLAKLVATGALEVKVVDLQESNGIYHDKIGIFVDDNNDKVLFVGSANETKYGILQNYEKIRISMSWNGSGDLAKIEDDELEFDEIWEGNNKYLVYCDLNKLIESKVSEVASRRKINLPERQPIKLRPYQEEAIQKWLDNEKNGFYEMATGTGKTWTAIYTAKKVLDEENTLLVICAPYKHLVRQWYEDVIKVFKNYPTVMVSSENTAWSEELANAIMQSKYGKKTSIIVISTIKSFFSERFSTLINKSDLTKMLIVDEAHRFRNLSESIKKQFCYKLGLSATPAKNAKDEFAKELTEYFGGVVYRLTIETAIEKGHLVHYKYYPIFVNATDQEEEQFKYYTKRMLGCFKKGVCVKRDEFVKQKRARLRVIGMAQEKREKFNEIMSCMKEKDHFIVYCGDGKIYEKADDGLRHIQDVKNKLTEMNYKCSQFTASENISERMNIVKNFNKGMIDCIVAIRCLDEGINIPSIEGALILTSNDDYREFVQRRGRILRTYYNQFKEENKKTANIYDVIVLPSEDTEKIAEIELRRMYEYMRLADNCDELKPKLNELMSKYGLESSIFSTFGDEEDDLDE